MFPTHFSMRLGFRGFLNPCLFPEASAVAEEAAFPGDEEGGQHDGQQEADHVQGVVLVPGEVVGCGAQVRCPLVPHHKLHPEHSQVQRLHGPVLVKAGQAHDVLLVAKHREVTLEPGMRRAALAHACPPSGRPPGSPHSVEEA